MSCYFLLEGIFLTQRSKLCILCILHWQADSLLLELPGKPIYWLGQKVHCGVSMSCYGKPRANFLSNPVQKYHLDRKKYKPNFKHPKSIKKYVILETKQGGARDCASVRVPGSSDGKESACDAEDLSSIPGSGVFLLGKHGWRSLTAYGSWVTRVRHDWVTKYWHALFPEARWKVYAYQEGRGSGINTEPNQISGVPHSHTPQ